MSDTKLICQKSSAQQEAPLKAPTWLDKSFIAQNLRAYHRNNAIEVTEIDIKPATAIGENYWSNIYRVKVDFTDSSKNTHNEDSLTLIVKSIIPNGTEQYLNTAVAVFEKEIQFYREIAPKMNALLTKLEIDRIFPEVYGVCELNKVLLLEDLNLSEFQQVPIRTGFNMTETKDVLKKLAAFHAIGALLKERHPNAFDEFKYGLISPPNKITFTFFTTQFEALLEQISTWPNFTAYATKLSHFQGKLMAKAYQASETRSNQFNTLVHSDVWANNIMVKPDSRGIVNDAVLIDFQFIYWGSPAIDLHYFLFTTFQTDPSIREINELVAFYHEYLAQFLLQLNYGGHVPTLDEFQFQFEEKYIYGFLSSCLEKPRLTYAHAEEMDLESTAIGNERTKELKRRMFQTEEVKESLTKMIPFFDEFGVFD